MAAHPPKPPEITIVKWDMRRLYNEGNIKPRAKRGEFRVKIKTYKPNIVSTRIPIGSKSLGTYYYDTAGVLVARFHHYESPKGRIIGLFDPKFLLIDGVEYHLPEKGQPEPPRIGNIEINRILRKSGIRAWFTYLYHYSEQVRKVWKEQVRDRLARLGIIEGRGCLVC